jgi:hypothetical protein
LIKRLGGLGLIVAGAASAVPHIATAQIGVPTISSPYLDIDVDERTDRAHVVVTATIAFSEYNVNQMKDGLYYAVRCKVIEADDNPDDHCFDFQKGNSWGRNGNADTYATFQFPRNRRSPTRTESVRFSGTVPKGWLNHDDNNWTRNFVDEIYGELRLLAAASGGRWEVVRTARTNRVDGRF